MKNMQLVQTSNLLMYGSNLLAQGSNLVPTILRVLPANLPASARFQPSAHYPAGFTRKPILPIYWC